MVALFIPGGVSLFMHGKLSAARCALMLAILTISGCSRDGLFIMTPFDAFGAPVAYDDSSATVHLAVAAVSMASAVDDKAANLARMAAMVAEIKAEHPDVQVIVFGELILGLLYDPDIQASYQQGIAETIPGASTAYIAGVSALYGTVIVFGMAEADNGSYFNSQAMVFPDGTVLTYRKRGLNPGDIAAGFLPGQEASAAVIDGVKVTCMICSDYQYEEAIRDVARSDADVVLMSLGNATRLSMQNDFIARQVNKWVVHANRFDPDLGISGLSYIADPAGAFRDQVEGESVYAFYTIGVYK
jgi:predicted amidohydrolase